MALVTAVASAHIGHLGSLEAIADEKASVLGGLVPGGLAILPGDSPFLSRMAEAAPGRVITFGQAEGADARLLQTEPVRARVYGETIEFPLAAPGAHMALNAVAALAACAALGLDVSVASTALSSFVPGAGRGAQRPIRGGDILLLDESYNASSASVRAALGVLATLPGRRVAVLGDMLELGAFGPAEHAGLVEDVTSSADLLYACGPLMRHLYDGVPDRRRGAHAPDSTALAPLVADAVRPGDAVLVKGSLGSRMRLVVAALEQAGAPG